MKKIAIALGFTLLAAAFPRHDAAAQSAAEEEAEAEDAVEVEALEHDQLVVGDLADRAGMSGSAFFEHFRAVTGTSPLQYQKDLRLLRAREALRSTNGKVSEIAFGVGYESSAQFSREYARKFGLPPRQDRAIQPAE